MAQPIARLHVQRGGPEGPPQTDVFEVPFTPGESVLDALRRIRTGQDPTLAVRYSCINANACKECIISINGKTGYACTTRLEAGDMHLAPLPNKRLIRDLVTDITPPGERYAVAEGD